MDFHIHDKYPDISELVFFFSKKKDSKYKDISIGFKAKHLG